MKPLNFTSKAISSNNIWTKEYLIKVLSEGKNPILTDPLYINAFLQVDRVDFVPMEYKHLAYVDIDIPLPYDESLTKPSTVAQMISLLKPKYGGNYLDIGTGTGYVSAILGYIAGETGKVYSIERVQWLWEMARSNLEKYNEFKNITVLYRDGLNGLSQYAPYDGIHIAFAMKEIPENIKMQLKVKNSRLIVPTLDYNLRVIERTGVDEWVEEIIPGFVFDIGKTGIS